MSKSWQKQWSNILPALAGFGVILAHTTPGASENRVPGLLLGGLSQDADDAPIAVDPRLPRGALMKVHPRPLGGATPLCSIHHPVCVHGDSGQEQGSDMLAALDALEAAYERVVLVLRLPAPLPDSSLGGGPELDLYLNQPTTGMGLDPARPRDDSASAFCTNAGTHFPLQRAVRCVGEAIVARVDAAAAGNIRAAYGAYLATLTSGPDDELLAQIDDWQSSPQLSTFGRLDDTQTPAPGAFFAFLEQRLSSADPATLSTALLALSRSSTNDAQPEWNNEPDVFDVLRTSLGNDRRRIANLLLDWSISRAFLGSRSDGAHAPNWGWAGNWGRVKFDWNVPYSSLPRNLAAARSIEPMGSSYVWLDLDEVPLGARLGVRIEWEPPVRFAWSVLSIDKDGREMNRWQMPYVENETRIEKTLMNFEAAAGLLFVGINLGGVDLKHPFDPDYEPWEPHSYSLYVTPL